MPARKSRRMKEQIVKLRDQGLSIRKTAEALKIHRKTVRKYLPEGDPHKKESVVKEKPFSWDEAIDWHSIHQEIGKGVSLPDTNLFKML